MTIKEVDIWQIWKLDATCGLSVGLTLRTVAVIVILTGLVFDVNDFGFCVPIPTLVTVPFVDVLNRFYA